jgi:hypothetical protein
MIEVFQFSDKTTSGKQIAVEPFVVGRPKEAKVFLKLQHKLESPVEDINISYVDLSHRYPVDIQDIRESVYDAIVNAGLLHKEASKEALMNEGLLFTSAETNLQIIKALDRDDLLDYVSFLPEYFSKFSNGIMFKITML